jgi:uncharacterized protein (TIGR02246 family)
MLFDANEFLDLLPKKGLRQRLAESWKFRLGAELLLVLAMGWLLWFTLLRVKVPQEVARAYTVYDQAVSARDPQKALQLFPSDVSIVVDGQPLNLRDYSGRLTHLLRSEEVRDVHQVTRLSWARRSNDDTSLQVRAILVQTIKREGKPEALRRQALTMLWRQTAGGWRLKSLSVKSLRPRA